MRLKPVKLSASATPQAVQDWLEVQGYGAVVSAEPLAGGCISNGVRLRTGQGGRFFLKTNSQTPKDMFQREAEGLEALRAADGPRVPHAYLHGPDFLLLEDLAPASRGRDYWTTFGQQLAALHSNTNERFGFDHDNYIGSTPQPNTWLEDGFEFFAEHRLGFQAELAANAGLLSNSETDKVERIAARLKELFPGKYLEFWPGVSEVKIQLLRMRLAGLHGPGVRQHPVNHLVTAVQRCIVFIE